MLCVAAMTTTIGTHLREKKSRALLARVKCTSISACEQRIIYQRCLAPYQLGRHQQNYASILGIQCPESFLQEVDKTLSSFLRSSVENMRKIEVQILCLEVEKQIVFQPSHLIFLRKIRDYKKKEVFLQRH